MRRLKRGLTVIFQTNWGRPFPVIDACGRCLLEPYERRRYRDIEEVQHGPVRGSAPGRCGKGTA
jgi:hypothetical protein